MFNAKKYKQGSNEAWNCVAEVYDLSFSALMYPAALRMIETAGLRPGDQVIDIAAGTGIDAFLALPYVGEQGGIVGIDMAPGMVRVANEKAQLRGTKNISFKEMDAEKLEFESNSFDAAISKWGFAYFPDNHKAFKEVLRVLKPGGRLAAMVLGRPEGSAFFTCAARAAFKHMPSSVTSTEGPTDFQFGPEGAMEAALNAAGFVEVSSQRFVVMIICQTGEQYWDLLVKGAGGFSFKISSYDPLLRNAIRNEVITSTNRYRTADGIRLPLEVLVGYGEKQKKGKESEEDAAAPTLVAFDQFIRENTRGIAEVTPAEAAAMTKTGAAVLDIRDEQQFTACHIPGATNIPRGRIEKLVRDVVPTASQPILVCSADGPTGLLTCRTLKEMGYQQVLNLSGGLAAWQGAGLQVQSGGAW